MSITTPVSTTAPDISSFGAGGQMYMASIWTGFNIRGQKINPLFAFNANSNEENAAMLTNLMETRKVGSTMAFRATRIGFRVLDLLPSASENPLTPNQLAEMKRLLASAVVTITLGANETKVAEFSGMDLMQAIDTVSADAVNTSAVAPGLGGGISWINLQIPIEIQANVNIGGTVKFNRDVPAGLIPGSASDPAFIGFVVILQGLKVVKS